MSQRDYAGPHKGNVEWAMGDEPEAMRVRWDCTAQDVTLTEAVLRDAVLHALHAEPAASGAGSKRKALRSE
jgi:hypothetical protein